MAVISDAFHLKQTSKGHGLTEAFGIVRSKFIGPPSSANSSINHVNCPSAHASLFSVHGIQIYAPPLEKKG
jgi:hypothetical protein